MAGPAGLAPWSPRPGLTLVLLLLLGLRYAAVPLAAELAAGLLVPSPGGRPGTGWLLLDAGLVALAWAATAAVLGGRLRLDPAMRRARDLGRLLLVAVAAAPLAAALPRVVLAAAAGLVPWAGAWALVVSWWARDAVGVALAAPLLAALVVRRVRPPAPGEALWRPLRGRAETAAQVVADGRGAGQAERRRLEAVLDANPDCVATVDREGRTLYLDQAGRRLLGLGGTEPLAGRRLADLLPQLAARLSAQADLGPARWTGATTLVSAGRRVLLEHVAVAHRAPDGRTEALSAITRDLSEARRMEGELAAAAERIDEQRLHLTAVTAHMPVALLVAKVDGTCLWAEGRALARLGTSPEALEGASLFQELEAHDQLVGDFCQAATGSAVSSWATVGSAVLETHFRPVVGRNGKVKQVIGLLGDVTERVRAETAAADLQARLDTLQGRLDSLDDTGTVRTLTAWLRHLEIIEEELAGGRPVTALLPVKRTLERVLVAGVDLAELPLPEDGGTATGHADAAGAPVEVFGAGAPVEALAGSASLAERDGERL